MHALAPARGLKLSALCKRIGNRFDVIPGASECICGGLLQRGPVAGLGEKDEEGLIGRLGLLRVHALEREWGCRKVRLWLINKLN
jgi:hypothetical protein